jgi:hypothetical protein
MDSLLKHIAALLPYETPTLGRRAWVRHVAYATIIVVLVLVVVQFQLRTMKGQRYAAATAAARAVDPDAEPDGKTYAGAIGRWRGEIHRFWSLHELHRAGDETAVHRWNPRHPNMPVVVLLLTPFAYLPVGLMAISFSSLKLLTLGAIVLMAVSIVNHRKDRMPDHVVLLGVLGGLTFMISDLQHGNTNVFVAGAVVGHLWLWRRGHDLWAGAVLALGICLKVTPLLFVAYWLYQRQWRMLAAVGVSLPLLMLSPALVLDWSFYEHAKRAWVEHLVMPGVTGQPYPSHINQSLPAIINRYFTSGDSGNYLWDPDYTLAPVEFAWITVYDLGERARWLLRGLQGAMVLAAGWVIGWRVLPRDDGRRGLHYGMIVSMMLLLNQRSWDHHAVYLVVAHLAVVYALARGNLSEWWKRPLSVIVGAAIVWTYITSGDLIKAVLGSDGADRFAAYGITFWHFLAMWGLCVVLGVAMRRRKEPYEADEQSVQAPDMASAPRSDTVEAAATRRIGRWVKVAAS